MIGWDEARAIAKAITFARRQMLAMAFYGSDSRAHIGEPIGAHVCVAKEKRTARWLEHKGLVTIQRPGTRTAGHTDWYVSITDDGRQVRNIIDALDAASSEVTP
jgi:hypothetical protein